MEEQELGIVTHYFGKVSVGIIQLSAPLKVGDTIHIKGAHDDFTQTVGSMEVDHKPVPSGKAGDLIGIRIDKPVHPNDKVFLVVS